MEEKDNITSSAKSSSQESAAEEDFNWISDKNFSSENKKDYLKYPLSHWRKLVYDPDFEKANIHSMGDYYEDRINKVLKNEVFKHFKFYESKNGIMKINLMENYKVDKNELIKDFIVPDFFVHQIEVEKFNELLENRKYMMRTFQKLNTNKKYVSIIGEIKISHHKAFKNNSQRQEYIKFIQKANSSEEELVLMYVYDESYKLFKTDAPTNIEKIFLIICYMPKLYSNDCYNSYNDIIEELKLNVKKIDIKSTPNKIPTKNELIKELKNELEKRKKPEKCVGGAGLFLLFLFILIIAFLIQKKIVK